MTETILRQTTKIDYKSRSEIYSGNVCSTWDKKLYLSLSRSKTIDAFAQESPRVRDLILAKLRQALLLFIAETYSTVNPKSSIKFGVNIDEVASISDEISSTGNYPS